MDKKKLEITSGNGLRLLSLDGGGARALSQIKIIENIMERVNATTEEDGEENWMVLPCECFDLIGGSDTGGILAIMFGKLSMTVQEAYIEFNKIHQEVYTKNLSAEKQTKRLQDCIENLLNRRGLSIDLKLRGDGGCPCFVVATPNLSLQNKIKLRSYDARADFSTNVTVVEAVLATCAAQPIFTPVSIGSGISRQELIGGTIGLANPSQELITEAQDKFDFKEKVSIILSIGAGHPGVIAAPPSSSEQWAETLWRMVTNSEQIAQDMENRLGGEGIYFCFSVNQAFPNHYGAIDDPGLYNTFTQDYLDSEEIVDKLRQCVEALRLRLTIVGLEQLTGLRAPDIGCTADLHRLMEEKEHKILEGLKHAEMKPGPLPAECMGGTRQDILQEIENWVSNTSSSNVLWVIGHPGVGKSAIASTVINNLRRRKRLGASFFFQRAYASVSSAHALWRTVAFDLAVEYQSVRQHLVTKLEEDPDMLTTGSIDDLFRQLIYEPLMASKNIPTKRLPVVVIDALDECGGLDGQLSRHRKDVLRTLSKWFSLPKWFKLIVTSRSEQDIDRVLHNNSRVIEIFAGPRVSIQSSEDIKAFLAARFQRIADEYPTLVFDWPGDQLIQQLTKRAGGLFIWARTVVEFIDRGEPEKQLDYILEGEDTVGDMAALYSQILQISFQDPTIKVMNAFHAILGAIIILRRPLPATSVARLLSIEDTRMQYICHKLKAVVDMEDVLQINHQTFVDFLLDSKACPSAFCIQLKDEEQRLVIACLQGMHRNLRFNICGLESSCVLNSEVHDMEARIHGNIPKYVLYSCQYWAEHLLTSKCELKVLEHLRYFTENQFLPWLEVLSVTSQMNIASNMLSLLRGWIKKQNQDESMVADMERFTTTFASVMAQSAPHIYISALPFAPRHSAVSKKYAEHYPPLLRVERGGLEEWPGFEYVMYGHGGVVSSVALSSDGTRIVSGSEDKTVRVWDAATGQPIGAPFKGHTAYVSSVAFSPDGTRIVSGSNDKTVRMWDAATGQLLGAPFEGHTSWVTSVAFSPDGTSIVLGSYDKTVRVWDAATGQLLGAPFEGHTSWVTLVAFSPDGTRILSSPYGEIVRVWDAVTGQPLGAPFKGYTGQFKSVAFSPDGTRIVSGSIDKTVRMWDAATGQPMGTHFEGQTSLVMSVAFSRDGTRVALASYDKTVRVWDAITSRPIGAPLKGHTHQITSVAFSPDGTHIVFGSWDNTVRVWDAAMGQSRGSPFEGHTDSVRSIAFSPDGTRIVSGSSDKTVQVWDVAMGYPLGTAFKGHNDQVTSVVFSPDGTRIASGSRDDTIRVWDAATGQLLGLSFEGHVSKIESLAFSPDGTRLISGSYDWMVRVWDAASGQPLGEPFEGHTHQVTSVAFSTDGTQIVSGSYDKTVRIWDAATGQSLGSPFKGHTRQVTSVTFSPDGSRIVSGSWDKTVRVWDAATGQPIGSPFEGHTEEVTSVAFSPDGTRVVSGSYDKTVRMWDVATGQPLGAPFGGHTEMVTSVAFSPDGAQIVSGSHKGTVRIWDTVIYNSNDALSFRGGFKIIEGWVVNPNSERLFWVLPSLQSGLWLPGSGLILGNFITEVNMEGFRYGKSWTNCQEF